VLFDDVPLAARIDRAEACVPPWPPAGLVKSWE